MRGTRLGPYEVVRLIGHGATASVFEAKHVALGKPVAMKLLHEHLSADEQVMNRFLREGRVAARLRHPNTVNVLDVGVEAGTPYLVMELLSGGDLRALLADTHLLTLEHALGFLLPIASALGHAHDEGVIHRDLKPANIFLARDLRDDVVPKLVDFGLSKVETGEATSSLTATELVAGTVLYMAPEQTLGVRHSSPASDQYSLAAILYECVTGEPPFMADGIYALIDRIRTDMVRPPSHLNPRLPEAFDAVLLRALHRDPAKRFPSVRALGRALLPFAGEATIRELDRDFLDRTSAAVAVGSRPSIRKAQAEAETRIEPVDAKSPGTSAIRTIAPLPCAPGESPFHIKGMPYRGFVHLLKNVLPGGVDAFCEALDDARLRAFVRQPFLASGRYDVFPFVPLFASLAGMLDAPFEGLVRRTAAAQATYDARTVFRAMWATADVDAIADRIGRFGAQYYDFGKFTGSVPEPNVLVIVHAGVPAYLGPWYAPMHVSYTEECARRLGAEIVSTQQESTLSGTQDGYPLFTSRLEIRWR